MLYRSSSWLVQAKPVLKQHFFSKMDLIFFKMDLDWDLWILLKIIISLYIFQHGKYMDSDVDLETNISAALFFTKNVTEK